MIFECPLPAALPTVPKVDCPVKLDQILGFAAQRRQAVSTFPAAGGTPKPIADLDSWTPLLVAANATKVTISPLLANFVIPPSEGQEEGGGDNSTPFGIPVDLGENAVKVTFQYRNLPVAVKAALEGLRAESQASVGISRLWFYLFNKEGQIIHNVQSGENNAVGIPVYNFRLSSRGSAGLKADDIIEASFYLPEGWDKAIVITTPNFNPLLEL